MVIPAFAVMLTNVARWDGKPAYPRYAERRDGGWTTYDEREAKQWRTPGGARRWLAQRPDLQGVVYAVGA